MLDVVDRRPAGIIITHPGNLATGWKKATPSRGCYLPGAMRELLSHGHRAADSVRILDFMRLGIRNTREEERTKVRRDGQEQVTEMRGERGREGGREEEEEKFHRN